MRSRTLASLLGAAATLAGAAVPAAAVTAPTDTPAAAAAPASPLDTVENNCFEVPIARAVLNSEVDPLVPTRYSIFRISPTASRLFLTTYTCTEVTVAGQVQPDPVTVSIGWLVLNDLAGQPDGYILWYGTDNVALFRELRQRGLPAKHLDATVTTLQAGDVTSTIDWTLGEAGLSYHLNAVGTEPTTAPVASTLQLVHDTVTGDQIAITYDNQLRTGSTALITGNISGIAPLRPLLVPTVPTVINGVRFPYVRGSWTSAVTVG